MWKRLTDGLHRWLTSGLLRKMLVALLVVALVPMYLIATSALQSFQEVIVDIVARSTQDLDQKSFDGLEARTNTLAQTLAAFLRERENDLLSLAALPRQSETYLSFANSKQGQLWTVIRESKDVRDKGVEVYVKMPLYREIAFIDATGQERIKITNECNPYPFSCKSSIAGALSNVQDPANTLYKNEIYFSETIKLGRDESYVGRPVGFHVPQERAYAGTQNRSGERYRGVLRFATPVFDGDKKVGVVVLAMEWLHFVELTAHIAPANPIYQAEIDPREADFAYVIDAEGWAISHPRHFNIAGVDETGKPVPAINEQDKDDPGNLYRPGNLTLMGFLAPAFPELVKKNRNGEAANGGVVTTLLTVATRSTDSNTTPSSARERALGFATIPYYSGQYNTKAGFGLVILSTDGARFHLESQLLGKRIDNSVTAVDQQVRWLAIGTFIVVFVLALFLVSNIAFPILRLTDSAQEIESGHWDKANIDTLGAKGKGGDEVARLTRVFASMAKEMRAREEMLRKQVQELKIVIDETKRQKQVSEIVESDFFQNLAEKAQAMREQRKRS